MKWYVLFLALLAGCSQSPVNNSENPVADTVRIPLDRSGTWTYKGFDGGLYAGGSNSPPAPHLARGIAAAQQVVPRDVNGNPAPTGKIVMLSIGMSNGTQEFCNQSGYVSCQPWSFMGKALANPAVNHSTLVIVNGARGGQVASAWATATSPEYTRVRDQGLQALGLSEAQVQVVWTKLANAQPTVALPHPNADAFLLRASISNVVTALKTRYPNLQLVFMSSRTYAGYATTGLNPEPYAYETGFAHKWAIEDNMQTGTAPWIGWAAYLWDPEFARGDFEADGTHPSQTGEAKVAEKLLSFFMASPFARPWFLAD